jgi:IS30 family transposase
MLPVLSRKRRYMFTTYTGPSAAAAEVPCAQTRHSAIPSRLCRALRPLPEDARRTVTFDRGSEFAAYPRLTSELAVASYFRDPPEADETFGPTADTRSGKRPRR